MNSGDRLVQLARLLIDQTRQGTVQWTLDPMDRGPMGPASLAGDEPPWSTEMSGGSVQITSRDRDGAHPFMLTVYNSDGVQVESLGTSGSGTAELPELLGWEEVLADLYKSARGSGLGVGEVVDSLIEELERKSQDAG